MELLYSLDVANRSVAKKKKSYYILPRRTLLIRNILWFNEIDKKCASRGNSG